MKRWGMLAISTLGLAAGFGASSGAIRAASGSDVPATGQRLEGTWLYMANLDSAPPGTPLTIVSLQTFMPDGAFFETAAPSPLRSPIGHGQWVRAGDRLFTATFTFLIYDGQGQQAGTQRITSSIRLSEELQEFCHASRNERFDIDGKLVFSGTATGTA